MTLNRQASSCSLGPKARPKFELKDAAQRRGYRNTVVSRLIQLSVTDSLFSGLGVKRFSNLLIEGVAFAFGREPFVFRVNKGFAFL